MKEEKREFNDDIEEEIICESKVENCVIVVVDFLIIGLDVLIILFRISDEIFVIVVDGIVVIIVVGIVVVIVVGIVVVIVVGIVVVIVVGIVVIMILIVLKKKRITKKK